MRPLHPRREPSTSMDDNAASLADAFEEVFNGDHGVKPFPLLKLPPEVWIRVLELAVTIGRPINVAKASSKQAQALVVRQPAITRTCHLLRNESLPAFYRNNVFEARHFCERECPRQWLLAIGEHNLKAMKTFLLHSRMSNSFWSGCFTRIGIETEIEVTSWHTKGSCPYHDEASKFRTMTVTFL